MSIYFYRPMIGPLKQLIFLNIEYPQIIFNLIKKKKYSFFYLEIYI